MVETIFKILLAIVVFVVVLHIISFIFSWAIYIGIFLIVLYLIGKLF